MEEYQAAFESIDPITLNTQSPAPKGSPVGKNFEDYFAAVEEWSDGKITFNVSWANAVAAAPEVDEALADGRLDVGSVMAGYDSDNFPAYAALSDTSYMGNGNPLEMVMVPHGYVTELALANEQVTAEFEAKGLKILAPVFTGGINGIYCSDERRSLDELKGAQVRISGSAHAAEAQALGMSPVSLAFEEVYEALQRGVLDCAFAGATVVQLGDLLSVAPHVILGKQVSLGQVPSALAMSEAVWGDLPLVAQQLLYDRGDVFVESNMRGLLGMFEDVLGAVDGKGGSIGGLDDQAQEALDRGNAAFLAAVADNDRIEGAPDLVAKIEEASARWREKVADLGYDTSVEYAEFPAWVADNPIELEPYMEKVRALLDEHRPA
ncbi:C4-dicarboxylate ABC transporter substrate-binding protein [Georgenia ruanii]|uniref:C4-dicarboxylate ABC transporter substrate-binding protein n=2 Tax=Georgenia ruanii TaxID=348442 RepID=A0A7J9UV07_9MICO|nr:C4-dicarboxylate ABC transporter substrate-binding protein [Georgenia ruanii]